MSPPARPAWYALQRGGWRDYVTLLHPPYTAWHLSYVVIGGRLTAAAETALRLLSLATVVLAATLVAFRT